MTKSKKKEEPKFRFLWSSNAPFAHSGYSTQTRDVLLRLKDKYDIAVSCFYGLEGGVIDWEGLKLYPKMQHTYGTDACVFHQQDFGAECVITFQDVWPMDMNFLRQIKNWIAYVPVDYYPCPVHITERLKLANRVVSISRFGQKALEEKGIQSKLILEAVDTNLFKPMDKMEMRKMLGIPQDLYMFGMVAVNKDNPPRKSFQHVMDAFADFVKTHPKSGLYFQCLLQQDGGFPIQEYAEYLGILKNIYYPPPYKYLFESPTTMVAKIMNTFDCLLQPSNSEGFGLPIIEAQSCGVPVIVNDWCSMPELVKDGKTGYICKAGDQRWSPIGAYMTSPDRNSLREKMELAFNDGRVKLQKACRNHILDQYDLDKRVFQEWIPFLEEVKNEIRRPRTQIIQSYSKP
jgi:glycosyltransferase involved in cell wall biosynthesis